MSKGTSPIGRVSYPHLFVAQKQKDENGNVTKEDYSVVLLFDKDDPGLAKLREVAKAVSDEKWPKKKPAGVRSPFRDGDEKDEDGQRIRGPEYEGKIFVTFRSKRKPGVVGPNPKVELSQEDVYPGCYGRVSYSCFAYDQPQNKGVSFALNNFQFARDGERLDAVTSADEDFEALEEVKTGDDLF